MEREYDLYISTELNNRIYTARNIVQTGRISIMRYRPNTNESLELEVGARQENTRLVRIRYGRLESPFVSLLAAAVLLHPQSKSFIPLFPFNSPFRDALAYALNHSPTISQGLASPRLE